ncbi:ABC transporter ATP-binding protein [Terriglobus sp.]|uniref:ABC transporter ATP-binding protein n=1 Tax=Terriglobus sp. TaxID=1889013 RepID=UPI003AFFF770
MATIDLQQLRKSYNSTEIIKGIDLTIRDQEFTVFVGPSGCGKSTLLRMIAGLEEITSGELRIDGQRVNEVAPAKRGLALVFQSYALYPHMTVAENMSFSLKLAGVNKTEREAKVTEAARILHLEPLLDRKPKDLSGGQRQRVAIGRAIVRHPRVFLFDEPLSNLDAALRVRMRQELTKLHRELKATMVYVTHDQVEAMTMADRIVVLQGGLVEQVGTPMELYRQPANLFVAGFIGSPRMNFFTATVQAVSDASTALALTDGTLIHAPASASSLRVGDTVTLGIRPEHLEITGAGAIRAQVQSVEHLGSDSYVYLQASSGEALTVRVSGETKVAPEQDVQLAPDLSFLHLFDATAQRIF